MMFVLVKVKLKKYTFSVCIEQVNITLQCTLRLSCLTLVHTKVDYVKSCKVTMCPMMSGVKWRLRLSVNK